MKAFLLIDDLITFLESNIVKIGFNELKIKNIIKKYKIKRRKKKSISGILKIVLVCNNIVNETQPISTYNLLEDKRIIYFLYHINQQFQSLQLIFCLTIHIYFEILMFIPLNIFNNIFVIYYFVWNNKYIT
jgi:hypothetical protein